MPDRTGQRRGLVLSGGGFFGAFQAGVYEYLSPYDCVVGASAGALNAWAIASGMPPAELQHLWLDAARTARAGGHIPRFWGDGFLESRNLEGLVRTLVRDWRPKVPLGVVISQGWQCRQVLVTGGLVDAEVLLASCAVPLLLPARRIGGRLSVDGGLRDVCPLWAARELGAGELTGVNVWTHLPWWWPGQGQREDRQETGVTMVEPAQRLGPLRASAMATPQQVAKWMEEGRRTAQATFARQ